VVSDLVLVVSGLVLVVSGLVLVVSGLVLVRFAWRVGWGGGTLRRLNLSETALMLRDAA